MDMEISPEMYVADLLDRWPAAMPIFIKHRMSCVGCSMSPFDTLSDVAGIYNLNLRVFLQEISATIAAAPGSILPSPTTNIPG